MPTVLSSRALRAELGARNLARAARLPHEVTFGRVPSVVYAAEDDGTHGNFLPAAYRRIRADAGWSARLDKAYTGGAQLPRARDRWRGELECAVSSDALLMNVFCYPGVVRRKALLSLLGTEAGARPVFGVRAQLPMRNGEIDRTELDMVLGDLCVEAKLTESGFGRAGRARLLRYRDVEALFEVDALFTAAAQISGGQMSGYQIVRGLLAAAHRQQRYVVLLDARRADLREICFRVLCAVRDAEVRGRFRLCTWQELAATLPTTLQRFLAQKYGIEPA